MRCLCAGWDVGAVLCRLISWCPKSVKGSQAYVGEREALRSWVVQSFVLFFQ